MLLEKFCSSIQVAAANKLKKIKVRQNKRVLKICNILFDLGYISGFTIINRAYVVVFLKFKGNKSVLRSLTTFSRSSSKIYFAKSHIGGLRVNNFRKSNSFIIFNTSLYENALLTDIECLMLGRSGEPICVVS